VITDNDECLILAKPLEDGMWGVGLFNLRNFPIELALNSDQLELEGDYLIRDVWRQQDVGMLRETKKFIVPGHGVVLTRLRRSAADDSTAGD
jgi:alpha-galactosidase